MSDLIDRQAVINKINERQRKLVYCFGFENDLVKIMNIAKSIIIAIPSAQPEDVARDIATIIENEKDMRVILKNAQPETEKYEYHYDHTDCIWYRPEARNRCPTTCAQYRDGWNDAMNYIFRDGKGYRPYRRDKQYGE